MCKAKGTHTSAGILECLLGFQRKMMINESGRGGGATRVKSNSAKELRDPLKYIRTWIKGYNQSPEWAT